MLKMPKSLLCFAVLSRFFTIFVAFNHKNFIDMAKNNIFLGTGSGKLGDVVLMRRDGRQVARAYIASPANPRTVGQSIQRNFLAPVAKFYAPLADVLESSWEGMTRAASYQAFLKHNINAARKGGYYVPKGQGWLPLPYRLSKGTIQPVQCIMTEDDLDLPNINSAQWVAEGQTVTVGDVARAFVNSGYQEGDQFTFVGAIVDDDTFDAYPAYCRMLLDSSSTTPVTSILPPGFTFTVESGESDLHISYNGTGNFWAGTVIISRVKSGGGWLRSTQDLKCASQLLLALTSITTRDNAIASYMAGSSVNVSDVYLNQSNRAPESNRRTVIPYAVSDTAMDDGMLRIMYPLGLEVRSTGVVVTGADASTGEVVESYVINSIPNSAAKTHILSTLSSWATTSDRPEGVNLIPVTSATDDAAVWLVANGVTSALFQ